MGSEAETPAEVSAPRRASSSASSSAHRAEAVIAAIPGRASRRAVCEGEAESSCSCMACLLSGVMDKRSIPAISGSYPQRRNIYNRKKTRRGSFCLKFFTCPFLHTILHRRKGRIPRRRDTARCGQSRCAGRESRFQRSPCARKSAHRCGRSAQASGPP